MPLTIVMAAAQEEQPPAPASASASDSDSDSDSDLDSFHRLQGLNKREQSEAIKKLLEAGTDIDAQDSLGWTALHRAASSDGHHQRGDPDLMRQLIDAGASLDIVGNEATAKGRTALHLACLEGNWDCVLEALAGGAPPMHINLGGFMLTSSEEESRAQCAAILQEARRQPDAAAWARVRAVEHRLLRAAGRCDVDGILEALVGGASLTAISFGGTTTRTALDMCRTENTAFLAWKTPECEALLESAASQPQAAVWARELDRAAWFESLGSPIKAQITQERLYRAACSGDIDGALEAMAAGASPTKRTSPEYWGTCPLEMAKPIHDGFGWYKKINKKKARCTALFEEALRQQDAATWAQEKLGRVLGSKGARR